MQKVSKKWRKAFDRIIAEEEKREISVSEAVKTIQAIEGTGSSVMIGIEKEKAPLASYISILKAIADNPWTELEYIDSTSPHFLKSNIQELYRTSREGQR